MQTNDEWIETKKIYKASTAVYFTEKECVAMRKEIAGANGLAGRICILLNCEVENPTLARRLDAIIAKVADA